MTSERLSDGEKVVWAAIFARQFLDGVADSSVSDLGDGAEAADDSLTVTGEKE